MRLYCGCVRPALLQMVKCKLAVKQMADYSDMCCAKNVA